MSDQEERVNLVGAPSYVGAEGIWIDGGLVYFTTKGDNAVWIFDPLTSQMEIVYRAADHADPMLTGVDNILTPFLRIVGQDGSEIAGPAFDASGARLYFSSMSGESGLFSADGVTSEVSGPFNTATAGGGKGSKGRVGAAVNGRATPASQAGAERSAQRIEQIVESS